MNESDIRPTDLFEQYLQLATQDTRKFFDYPDWKSVDCPACSSVGNQLYVKEGFTYCRCPSCLTIYVNPSPPPSAFYDFYANGKSTEFWSTHFYKKTEKVRREKIWKPKARKILELIKHYNITDYSLVDVGGGYGIFCEEFCKISKVPVVIIEPSNGLALVCSQKGFPVIETFLENVSPRELPSSRNVFVCFELFEHLHSPASFIKHLWGVMKPGDYLFLTTLSGTGFDVELLGEYSKSIHPPHHVNFFNPCSIASFLDMKGLDVLEVQTPGKLDVDIAYNQRHQVSDKFLKVFLENSTYEQRNQLQSTLADNQLSSHMLVVCRKN